jgi:hypothetical protein
VHAPGNPENKLCELFVPYKHAMRNFYNLIESLYTQQLPIQTTSFLETMDSSFQKRQARLGKNNIPGIRSMMKSKSKPKSDSSDKTCKVVPGNDMFVTDELETKKRTYCKGYNHLDLSDTNVKNIAVHYIEKDMLPQFAKDDKMMNRLKNTLRYQVTDTSCPSPLFTAKDISIQQVAMDVLGSKKEWAAVVNLNTKDDNGYLQSELPYCERKDYLIGSKVSVRAFIDERNCCGGEPNYEKCMKLNEVRCLIFRKGKCFFKRKKVAKCADKLKPLPMRYNKKYAKLVELRGTQYSVKSVNRRRRLFRAHRRGC